MTHEIETTDETMEGSAYDLADRVIGHKIVDVSRPTENSRTTYITLDNGKRVSLRDTDDCCAYTELEAFSINPAGIDHVITSVGTEDGYSKWHIYASGIPVVDLEVAWGEGSGYYGYGFEINVEDVK